MIFCCSNFWDNWDFYCPDPFFYCSWDSGNVCNGVVYWTEVCRMEGWLIGVIAAVCAVIFFCFIGCIYCCCFRRPKIEQRYVVVDGSGAAFASASANTTTVVDTAPLLQNASTPVGVVIAQRRR